MNLEYGNLLTGVDEVSEWEIDTEGGVFLRLPTECHSESDDRLCPDE